MCHLSELGDAIKFLFVKKKTKYGIRAGSTRDLGFATAFVDMSGFYYTVVD
jgi:hypothetical protein